MTKRTPLPSKGKLVDSVKRLTTLIFTSLLCTMCTTHSQKTLFKADCNGHTLELQLKTKETFETAYHHHELLYDGKVVDVIDNDRLSSMPPYDPTVYGNAPWHYIDTTRQYYQPKGFNGPLKKIPVMLFINADDWTPQAFEQLYACMQQYHKGLEKSMMQEEKFQPYQFGGMVYGGQEDFVKTYAKTENDYFKIYPDGRIIHTLRESFGMTISSSNGLSAQVQMPGRRILINTAQLPMRELTRYRNPDTKHPLNADFTVEVDTAFHSR